MPSTTMSFKEIYNNMRSVARVTLNGREVTSIISSLGLGGAHEYVRLEDGEEVRIYDIDSRIFDVQLSVKGRPV